MTTDQPTHPHEYGPVPDGWSRVRPVVFRTIIGAVVAASLIGVVAVLIGAFGTVALQLLLTIVVVIVFALLSWYDADVSSRRSGAFAAASIATSMYLLVVGLCKIWIVVHADPSATQPGSDLDTIGAQFWQWIGLAVVARAALLHVHLLLIIHRRYPTPALQIVARTTVVVIALLAVLVSLPILFAGTHFAHGYWRLLWTVAIIDLLGTVLVPLSNALFRPRHDGVVGLGTGGPVGPGAGVVTGPGAGGSAGGWPVGGVAWEGRQDPAPHPAPAGRSGPVPDGWASAPTIGAAPAEPGAFRYEPAPPVNRALAWPRYVDGTPLPALSDGTPDFSGVDRR